MQRQTESTDRDATSKNYWSLFLSTFETPSLFSVNIRLRYPHSLVASSSALDYIRLLSVSWNRSLRCTQKIRWSALFSSHSGFIYHPWRPSRYGKGKGKGKV